MHFSPMHSLFCSNNYALSIFYFTSAYRFFTSQHSFFFCCKEFQRYKSATQQKPFKSETARLIIQTKSNNMKIILIIFIAFIMNASVVAQISGTIVNEKAQPVAAANVLLKSTDSSVIKATITTEEGKFSFKNISPGIYTMHISAIGYRDHISSSFEYRKEEVDTIILVAAPAVLQNVVVRSEKPLLQEKPEGTIVNAENSILTKGSTALQVLERSPGVVINKRDNSIELNGKSGVAVMLNGKLMRMSESQLLDLLSGMSGDDISSIELLTSPSAKYDAEGAAGIINIVFKKNKRQGTNAAVNVSAGYGYREKATAGFNISHNSSRVTMYGSYNFSHNNTYSNMYVDSYQDMPFLGGAVHALGWDTTYMQQNSHNLNLGADIKPDSNLTIGASIIYGNQKLSGTTWSHLGYNVLPDSVLQYDGRNSGKNVWNNIISSVYMEKISKQGGKINAGADYLYFNNNGPYNVEGTFTNKHGEDAEGTQSLSAPAQKGFAKTNIHVIVGNLDYTTQLSKQIQLETGMKASMASSNSYAGFESLINGVWTSDPQTQSNINMKENIFAAYASANTKLSESINVTAGLRYENAFTNMNETTTGKQVVKRSLSSFFPNIFFTKKINDQSELQLSYTKRITRPTYNDLASYVGYSDPTAVYTGNPFLQPTISNNIKLGYVYKTYSVSLKFSNDKNSIARYQLTESPQHDILYISPQNINNLKSITLQTILPFRISNWWTMNYDLINTLFSYQVNYSKQPFKNTYYNYYLQTTQSFRLPKSFSAELSGSYYNVYYNGSQKVNGIVRLNLGFKKELKNNKGSLQLSVTDLLQQEKYNIHYGTLTQEAFSINNHVIVNTETTRMPVFRLSYSRSFGSNKSANTKRNTVDELDRIIK